MITRYLIFSMEALKRCNERVCEIIKSDIMNVLMVTGIATGFIIGVVMGNIRKTPYSSREIMYVSFPGELFLRMLKGVAVILMTACLVTAIGTLEIRLSKRIGLQFMLYVILTKLLSALLAIILALILRPGVYGRSTDDDDGFDFALEKRKLTAEDTFMDIVRNMFPPNVVLMFLSSYQTKLIEPENGPINMKDWEIHPRGEMTDVANMLGIVCCSIFLGIALSVMAAEGKALLDLFRCITQVFMKITIWILWISPVLVIFLIAGQLLSSKGLIALIGKVGMYIVCMFIGFGLEGLLIMPLLHFVLIWKNPFLLMKSVVGCLVTAFATQSSLAAIPLAIRDLEKAGYDKRIVNFVIPVGININKDGSAMYQGIAAVFFAQMYERKLTFSDLMTILLMGVAVSMATAGIPFGALVMQIMILDGLNIPYKDVGLIIAVDWLVDRVGTVLSVWGNCVLTVILAERNKQFLSGPDEEQKSEIESPDTED